VVSLSSFNSPFDQYVRGERKELPEAAKRGFNLFMGKAACGTCHFAPSFNGLVPPFYEESESEVLGVPSTPGSENLVIDPDLGRLESSRPQDEAYFYAFSFKTPTVRNAALTAPYMHNGVYETMEEVIDFYNKGGGLGMGIDIPHQTLPDAPLNLNEGEVKDLIAFMEALTDTTGMTNIQLELPKFEGMSELNKRMSGGYY
jgi:cytochrome c peroxidase